MCTLVSDINSSTFLTIFYKIVSIFSYVQIIAQSLFPSDIDFWKTSKCSSFASILAFFARIVPESSSENFLQITIICIFFSMIIFSIICIWFFFSYSNPLFRNSHPPSLFMIPVGLSRLILIPSFSLLFHECNYFTNISSTPEFILSAVSVFCCLILSYFFEVAGNVVPYFSGVGSLSWITKDFIFEIGYIIIIVLQSEFLTIIKSRMFRIILLLGITLFHLFVAIYDVAINIKSHLFSFFSDIANLSLLLTNMLFFIREFREIDSGSFLLYYIFALVISYSILVFSRKIYKNFINNIAKNYLCDRDYGKILKYPRRIIMVILCSVYPNIGNDWEFFDLIINQFSHDYQFLFFYAKFLVLHPNEKLRIRKVIKDMKKIQGLDFVFSLQTRFIQLLLIQFDLDNELSIASRSKFSRNEVSNYFSSLRMFWTEVLLAKPNKLVTLSVNASNYFLDVVHNYAMNGIDLEQFKFLENVCIINKSRLLVERSRTPMKIISENRFFNTSQVINKLKEAENQIPNISRETFESKSVSDTILTWQHFSFYIPFYFALFAILFFGTYQFYSNSHFWHYFNFFQLLVNVTNYFASSEGMVPYIVAVESGIINSSGIVKFVIHDDFYRSSLLNPRQDAKYNAEMINSLFDELKESLLSFFNGSVINNLSKAQVCMEQIGHSHQSLSFVPCMEVARVKIESLLNLQIEDLQRLMTSDESKTIFYSTLKLLSFISSYAFNMTDWIPPLLDEREVRISKSLMTVIYIAAFFSFIMSCVSIFFLMRGYNHFFKILISIPKNEISNLISKIGSSSSNYSEYPVEVRYNINLLSYKSPPSSFHSNLSISIFLVFVNFILILSASVFINPLKNSLLSCIRGAFVNMNEMKLETIVVPYCFKMHYSLNEIVYLYKTNQTENANYDFFLNILKETADEAYNTMNSYMANFQPKIIKNFFQMPLVSGYTIQNTFQIMSMILYDFYSDLSHGKNPSQLDLVIGSVFRFMDNAIPRLLDQANDALINMKLYNNKMKALRFFIFLSILIFVFVIVDVILRPFKNGSVLFSVPLSTISLSEPEIEPSLTNENELLDSEAIFPKLGHYLLLVDKNNMIIKATDDAILFFDIEPNTITMDEFVRRIEKYPSEHIFPPKEIDQLDEHLDQAQQHQQQQQSQQLQQQQQIQVDLDQLNVDEPIAVFIDIDSCVPSVDSANGQDVFLRFMFIKTNLDDSSYAVVIDDITIIQTQIALVNEEANKVRMLIYQIIPWPVALTILSDDEYTPRTHGSLAIATFFIENADLDENIRIHKYLRESLPSYPNLTFFGRSVTFFRMATPVFDRNLSVAQHTEYLIRFSYDFVKKIKMDATLYSQPKMRKNSLNHESITNINASCSICNVGSIGSLTLPTNTINDNYSLTELLSGTANNNLNSQCSDSNFIENFPPFPSFLKNNEVLGSHIRRNGSSSTVSSLSKRGNISKSNSCDITTGPAKGNMLIEKKEQLRVRCSIDINGPYKSILPDIQNIPPYFSIYGKNEDVGLFISMNSRPNRVNVSQSVYESLYGIFNFDFENEIYTLDGKSILVYTVVDCPDVQ